MTASELTEGEREALRGRHRHPCVWIYDHNRACTCGLVMAVESILTARQAPTRRA